jgi:hypothetical protein
MDPMGNYTGYEETDEERRKRLEAEATPVTQTIKTNPVTGQQEMTIKGTPQDLSAANPRTPTVTAPVAPDQVFQRQIQAESAGQHIDPRTGQILTSPKGAQGIAQIMPSTAAQPGYGIKPATPEEIATKEGNMAFGERYKQGMLKAFGGDEQKATAAYNAGPNAIKRAEQQAQASGGAWTDYISKETMGYLGKVFGNMIPSANAGELTAQQRAAAPTITPSTTVSPTGSVETSATTPAVTPIAPTAQAQPAAPAGPVNPMYAFNATGGAPGLKMPTAMETQQAMETARRNQAVNEFQTATANPDAMIEYMNRKDVPDDLKTAMKINHFEALTAEKRMQKAEENGLKLVTEQPQKIPAMLRDPSEEGSAFKAWLFKQVGWKEGSDAELTKINLPKSWENVMDANGNTGMVLMSTSGRPLQGVKSDGTKMTSNELIAYASAGTSKTSDVSLTNHQALVDGKLHTFESKRTPAGLMYRDATANGSWSRTAPEGMTNIGQHDPGHLKGLAAKKQVETQMRTDNAKATSVGGQPLHSESAIQTAGNNAYQGIAGKAFAGATAAEPNAAMPTTATTTPAKGGAKSLAQQILDYDAPAPTGPTTPAKVALQNEVNRLAAEQGKTYDSGQYKIASKTRQDFLTGQQGKAVQSMNVAIDHLDTLNKAGQALNNGNIPLFNSIGNTFSKNTGNPQVTDFNALKSIVGSEVTKAVVGGATALGDREEIRAEINAANSPAQLLGVIQKYQQLMAGQVKGLKQTYESGTGRKDFDEKLLPRTKQILGEVSGEAELSPQEKARQVLEKRRKGQ